MIGLSYLFMVNSVVCYEASTFELMPDVGEEMDD